MKKLLIAGVLFCLAMGTVGCQQAGANADKKAMLVVSFGTSYHDTREVTLDAVQRDFEDKFSGYDVYRAFTAQTIIDILKERDNIEVYNVKEALDHLKAEGYGSVVVQSIHIMNGAEFHDVIKTVMEYQDDFAEIKMGSALMTSVEDYQKSAEALISTFPELADDEAVVLMGHGTHHPANSVYATFEKVFRSMGYDNVFVGTVEGFPTFDDVITELERSNIKKVTLMPMMMVAGDHASNDMAGDEDDSWKTMLKQRGYEVDIYLHGMGELQAIRDIFINHAEMAIEGDVAEGH